MPYSQTMKTIFELELISTHGTRYPVRKRLYDLSLGAYTTLEKAEKAMQKVVKSWGMESDTFCYIIIERKLNPKPQEEDMVGVRTYLPDGSWYEENMTDRDGVFRGRPDERIRFKIGDIAEVLYGDVVELAIIGNTPPSLEFAEQMRKRRLGNGVTDEFFMDKFDDSYTIYDTHPGGHTHVESQFVFPTRKPVSEKLVQKLKEQMEKGD